MQGECHKLCGGVKGALMPFYYTASVQLAVYCVTEQEGVGLPSRTIDGGGGYDFVPCGQRQGHHRSKFRIGFR